MRLVYNWRAVVMHAWSSRFMYITIILCGLEIAVPFLDGVLPIPRGLFAALAGVTSAAAAYARIVFQSKVSGDDQ